MCFWTVSNTSVLFPAQINTFCSALYTYYFKVDNLCQQCSKEACDIYYLCQGAMCWHTQVSFHGQHSRGLCQSYSSVTGGKKVHCRLSNDWKLSSADNCCHLTPGGVKRYIDFFFNLTTNNHHHHVEAPFATDPRVWHYMGVIITCHIFTHQIGDKFHPSSSMYSTLIPGEYLPAAHRRNWRPSCCTSGTSRACALVPHQWSRQSSRPVRRLICAQARPSTAPNLAS